ncbi:MAG: hypothetical protein WBL95_04625 [Microcoleus sp.]
MTKPYSYDLRQKVIQAIKLDSLKISGYCLLFSIIRNLLADGFRGKPNLGTVKRWFDFARAYHRPLGNLLAMVILVKVLKKI